MILYLVIFFTKITKIALQTSCHVRDFHCTRWGDYKRPKNKKKRFDLHSKFKIFRHAIKFYVQLLDHKYKGLISMRWGAVIMISGAYNLYFIIQFVKLHSHKS